MRRFLILFSYLLSAIGVSAQAPKYSNEFLSIGVGARSLGMAGSVVGSTEDVASGYWNPAGLNGIQSDMQVGLMHSEHFAGIAKFDYGSMAKRMDTSSVFGVSIIRFGIDNIPNTTELIDPSGNINYDRISTFSSADYAFMFHYARKLAIPGLQVGATAKVVHRRIGDFARSWGFGIDVAAQYRKGDWRFGAVARDITTTFNAWSYNLSETMIETFQQTGNEIPTNSIELTLPKLLLGAGRMFRIKENFTLLGEFGFDCSFDGKRNTLIKTNLISVDPHFGFEAGYRNLVFLRGGMGNVQRSLKIDQSGDETTFQPSIGIGVRIKRFAIDYALTDIGDQSVALYSNVFSLRFDISKSGL